MEKEIIQDIVNRSDIVSTISRYVKISKKGKEYVGKCPFHNDKLPSFFVYDDKYHCFGCGEHGDIIDFLSKINHTSFIETVKELASELHIDIDNKKTKDEINREIKEKKIKDNIIKTNKNAMTYYSAALKKNRYSNILKYCLSRNVTDDVINRFSVGYAPKNSSGFIAFMDKLGSTVDDMVAASLLYEDSNGLSFSDRLMFPIVSGSGDCLGFTGRAMDDSQTKYKNTAENPVFKKCKTQFGTNVAIEHIKKSGTAILTEGPFDVLAMHACGFKNTISLMGTAFSDDSLNSVRRIAENFILMFDGDAAGTTATVRAIKKMLPLGINVSVALMPENNDPSDLSSSPGELKNIIGSAKDGMTWLLDFIESRDSVKNTSSRLKTINSIVCMADKSDNTILRQLLIREVENRYKVDISSILNNN